MSVGTGGIELQAGDLKLKSGALDELGLPIKIKRGFLQKLSVKISLTLRVEV